MAKNYYQREHDARSGKLQQRNYASTSNQGEGDEQLFVMQHMANSMIGGVSDNNLWYVDFGASNHMTSHGEWFRDAKDLKTPRFVETGDDTTHPITQIGNPSMIVHIQDAKSPKQAWDTLVKMYSTNTQARKMQLKQELHNLQKNKMNISDYSTKVKNLADALASIGAPVDDEDLVVVTLNGLGKNYS